MRTQNLQEQKLRIALHIQIDKDVVRRILARHYRPGQDSDGPSWLTFLGHRVENQCACASLGWGFGGSIR